MFLGYLDVARRNQLVWRDGWFHTGDQGRFDDVGQLWFVDRLGDIIRCKGESVSAHEVEEVLVDHPSVALAAAYGVPSQLGDQDIVAAVIVKEGHRLTPWELHAWSGPRLARYAMPRYVDIVSELPMTPTGKIEKYKLRSRGSRRRPSTSVRSRRRGTCRECPWSGARAPRRYPPPSTDSVADGPQLLRRRRQDDRPVHPYLAELAAGGAALVYPEAAFVRADGRCQRNQMALDSDDIVPALRRTADDVHA